MSSKDKKRSLSAPFFNARLFFLPGEEKDDGEDEDDAGNARRDIDERHIVSTGMDKAGIIREQRRSAGKSRNGKQKRH